MRKNVLKAKYKIVTPMFSSRDAENAELRLASIKGVIRFWWRTLMWSTINDYKKLLEREESIFGSTNGQSLVIMRLLSKENSRAEKENHFFEKGKLIGTQYLAYGIAGQGKRSYISTGSFEIELWLHDKGNPDISISEIKEEMKKVLILLGTVGGVGAKSRKGYGSLTITGLNDDGNKIFIEPDLKKRIKGLLGDRLSSVNPEWTAWSTRSRLITVSGYSTPNKLLNSIGLEELYYRSWGNNGRVNGSKREGNFKEDHDLYYNPDGSHHPKRVVFGLPHNYGKNSNKAVEPNKKDLNRRASPLFIHIHQEGEERPTGIVLFLPARFLPKNEKIKSFGYVVPVADNDFDEFWRPITDFLDRLIASEDAEKPFFKATKLIGEEVALV